MKGENSVLGRPHGGGDSEMRNQLRNSGMHEVRRMLGVPLYDVRGSMA